VHEYVFPSASERTTQVLLPFLSRRFGGLHLSHS